MVMMSISIARTNEFENFRDIRREKVAIMIINNIRRNECEQTQNFIILKHTKIH